MGTVAMARTSPASGDGAGSFSPHPQEAGAALQLQEVISHSPFFNKIAKHEMSMEHSCSLLL